MKFWHKVIPVEAVKYKELSIKVTKILRQIVQKSNLVESKNTHIHGMWAQSIKFIVVISNPYLLTRILTSKTTIIMLYL